MTFAVFSLCPASSVFLPVAGKIKADSDFLKTYAPVIKRRPRPIMTGVCSIVDYNTHKIT